jgi:hypothetical protein
MTSTAATQPAPTTTTTTAVVARATTQSPAPAPARTATRGSPLGQRRSRRDQPEDHVPSHLLSDAGYWRLLATELRRLAETPNCPHRVTTALEAADAAHRADLLSLLWDDASA